LNKTKQKIHENSNKKNAKKNEKGNEAQIPVRIKLKIKINNNSSKPERACQICSSDHDTGKNQ
jgi:hypothetical protein